MIFVMAGLDPAIHALTKISAKNVDARVKSGHDKRENHSHRR
jgi:hypothetical protein